MNYHLDDEQRALAEAAGRFLREQYTIDARKASLALPIGSTTAYWSDYAKLGLLGLLIPEEFGGVGKGQVEAGLVMEQFGKALVTDPFAAVAIAGATCLVESANAGIKEMWLTGIAGGLSRPVVASAMLQQQRPGADVVATRTGGSWTLDGSLVCVPGADSATALIVDALVTSGGRALFVVEPRTPGVTLDAYRNHDGFGGADLTFRSTKVDDRDVVMSPGSEDTIEKVKGNLIAALCNEAVGTISAGFEMTLAYLKTRKQFGVALSSFQTLQHRCVDVLLALERARSLALFASRAAAQEISASRAAKLSAAKVQISVSARFAGQSFVQLHGGMGMTDEYAIGHAFRRLTSIELALGSADDHLTHLVASGGLLGHLE